MTQIKVGDKYSAPHNDGPMRCTVISVADDGQSFEARWTPGAPAYRYSIRKVGQWTKVN